MRIVQSPYQAREVVVLHETARKEDARCMALLELARLELTGKTSL
jgi:hypothetical protein